MLNFYDKFALGQSNATILVAYYSDCNFLLSQVFVKQCPDQNVGYTQNGIRETILHSIKILNQLMSVYSHNA